MKPKILFLVNIPAPYRIDFFNELGKSCDLTVLIETKTAEHRHDEWLSKKSENFKAVYLTPKKIGNKYICTDVKDYINDDFDVFVIGVYNTLTSIYAMRILKKQNRDFVISVDGGSIKNDNFIKKHIKKSLLSGASYWLSPSNESDRYLVHYGADSSKIYRYNFTSVLENDIVNSINISKDSKSSIRGTLGMYEEKIILSVGRFSYERGYGKGYDILMRLAEKLPDNVGVYIVGDEPTEEFVNWKKEKNLDHVHFVSFLSKEEIKNYYQAADLFVLLTRGDVWGLVINEAFSNGLPVITTDKCIAGLELVENGINGYIVKIDDEDSILEKIVYLINNKSVCESMSEAGLKKISKYTIEEMARQHLVLFNELNRKN